MGDHGWTTELQMSELINRRSSLAGKIPSGLFNSMFYFNGCNWARDAAQTKCLALDGFYISLFNLRIDRPSFTLADHVSDAVPPAWDPAALTRCVLPASCSPSIALARSRRRLKDHEHVMCGCAVVSVLAKSTRSN